MILTRIRLPWSLMDHHCSRREQIDGCEFAFFYGLAVQRDAVAIWKIDFDGQIVKPI